MGQHAKDAIHEERTERGTERNVEFDRIRLEGYQLDQMDGNVQYVDRIQEEFTDEFNDGSQSVQTKSEVR